MGGRVGQPGCPIPLLKGFALPHPPAGGGMGKPGFPMPLLQQPMFTSDGHAHGAQRRDAHGLGARASRPRRDSAGTVTAPSLTRPRREREPGASPQREEAGRGD